MNFSNGQASGNVPGRTLPQFSELRPVLAVSMEHTSGENMQAQAAQTPVYTTAAGTSQKQTSMNSYAKYTPPLSTWTDALMQLCEKQIFNQMMIPNYNQNNPMLSIQPNNLPASIISSTYFPSIPQADTVKQELNAQFKEPGNLHEELCEIQLQQQQAVTLSEYVQKIQAASLQEQIKRQAKKKIEEEKVEQTQNILNIPSVFRNTQLQNGTSFMNPDQIIVDVNPGDLSVHMENEQQENESNLQVLKVEQQVQTDLPKVDKKPKFRAKLGEIKINVGYDGTAVYCCPECNLGLPKKADMEQHIQIHLQERKYQCKECGAMLKRKEHLDQHMRGHSDERPFKCPRCHKAFKRNEHLTRHIIIHSGSKNFTCTVCQKAFSRKDHLNKHIQTHLGTRRKMKEDSFYVDQKDTTRLFDKNTDTAAVPKQEVNYILKDDCLLKQESLLQHIQNLQNLHKDTNLLSALTLKDQVLRDAYMFQQAQNINVNEVLPQNRHLAPS